MTTEAERDLQIIQHPVKHVVKTTAVGAGIGFGAVDVADGVSIVSRASFGSGAVDIKTHVIEIGGGTLLGAAAGAAYGVKEVRAARKRQAGE